MAFGDRNITELCVDYDLRNGTDVLSDFNATESESAAQVDPVEVDMLGNVTTTQQGAGLKSNTPELCTFCRD